MSLDPPEADAREHLEVELAEVRALLREFSDDVDQLVDREAA